MCIHWKKNRVRCVRFSNKWRCVLFLVPSSLYTYLFRCFWVKTICIYAVCALLFLFFLYYYFVSSVLRNWIQLSLFASLLFSCSRCAIVYALFLYGICMRFKLKDLVCLIVLCCTALRWAWDAFDFSCCFFFLVSVSSSFDSFLYISITANGVYVAMGDFSFFLCLPFVGSFHQVQFFIFFYFVLNRIWFVYKLCTCVCVCAFFVSSSPSSSSSSFIRIGLFYMH